jgi:hypothetical protein
MARTHKKVRYVPKSKVYTPVTAARDVEQAFKVLVTPDGFHGQVTRINVDLWEGSRRTKEALQELAAPSRNSLSTCHWIGSKSEGRDSALRCRGCWVGVGLINNAIGARSSKHARGEHGSRRDHI